MNNLYGKQRKVLKLIYKNYKKDKLVTRTELLKSLKLNKSEINLLCQELYENGFITYVGINYEPKLSVKGIDYFSSESGEWLSKNLIAILALIISIFAFIRTL